MYVLVVAGGYPTKKYKGNGIFEFDQAKALQRLGTKVVYIALDMRSVRRWRKWGVESLKKEEVQIESVNVPAGRIPEHLMESISIYFLEKLFLRTIKKYGKPDVIHCHFTHIGYYMAKVEEKLDMKIPIVLTEHSSKIIQLQISPYLYAIARYAYSKATRLIAVSPTLKNVIKDKFGIDAVYVPNMYDDNIFKNGEKIGCADGVHFISVGNLNYGKGMDILIKAFAKAFSDNKHVNLVIVGDGQEKDNLHKLIIETGMSEQIRLAGGLAREKIAQMMQKCNAFVLLSRYETFGVVYIEALASGLPVIATKCGGPETFVTNENGILVNVDDIEESAKALKKMAEEHMGYDYKGIATVTMQRFSSNAVADRLIELFRQCQDNNG